MTSEQARRMLREQLATWELAASNYRALEQVKVKTFDLGGFTVRVQFNPARIASTSSAVDKKSISERRCFLCERELPEEQIRLPFGSGYYLLCNPYPIFPEHFTIPTLSHTDQALESRFLDLLSFARQLREYTLFYNGPRCGASAPDHAHFQAVSREVMPIDREWKKQVDESGERLLSLPGASLSSFTGYLRNGFVIRATEEKVAETIFRLLQEALPREADEVEPKMNLFVQYLQEEWVVIAIPRKRHRPWQYDAESSARILTAPGAADMGGLFILPREEDFEKISAELLRNIYTQLCYSDEEINEIATVCRQKPISRI